MTVELLAQVPPPGPDPEPILGYVLSGLAVAVLYAATRIDTDTTGPRRRTWTRALFVLGVVVLLGALATSA